MRESFEVDPNRRPAHYALAQHIDDASDPRVRSFDGAHQQALLFALSCRIAARALVRSVRWSSLPDSLRLGWVDALAAACGDRALARRAIERASVALRAGTELEASSLRGTRLSPSTYAEQTRLKLRWRSATTRVLLQQSQGDVHATAFERCYDLFGLGVQCIDDAAVDAEGSGRPEPNVPRLLGVVDEAMVEAAIVLVERAAEHAARHGFGALCEWLARFDRFLREPRPDGDRLRRGREGRALGAALAREL